MKSTKLISLCIAATILTTPVIGSNISSLKTKKDIKQVQEYSSTKKNYKFSSNLKIYNSSNILGATLLFNHYNNEINVSINNNINLGTNNNSDAVIISLYKPKAFIPYKTVTINEGESVSGIKKVLNNVKYDIGDLVTVYTNHNVAKATTENNISNNKQTQNFIVTQDGLEDYSTSINLNKVNLNKNTKITYITGTTSPDAIVDANINGECYSGQANIKGNFSIGIPTKILNKNSQINISSYFGTPVKAIINESLVNNIKHIKSDNKIKNISSSPSSVKNKISNIMPNSITQYGVTVNPVNVISNNGFSTTKTYITGYAQPNSLVYTNVFTVLGTKNNVYTFSGYTNSKGYFSIPIDIPAGIYSRPLQPSIATNIYVYATNNQGYQITISPNFNNINLNNENINELNINSDVSSKILNITGKVHPNETVYVNLNKQTFKGTSNSNGYFSIPTVEEKEVHFGDIPIVSFDTTINGNLYTIKKDVPVNYNVYNIEEKNNAGFKYTLNNSGVALDGIQTQLSYFENFLNPNQVKALKLIYSSIISFNNKIYSKKYKNYGNNFTIIPINFEANGISPLSVNELNQIMNIVANMPRVLFSIENALPIPYSGANGIYNFNLAGGVNIAIRPNFNKSDTYQKTLQEINSNASTILDKITPQMNEYQIIATIEQNYLNDYIYDGEVGLSYNQTILGPFLKHKAVCAGIAQGMSYMLNKVGIEAIPVCGEAVNGQPNSMHEWDEVDIYGKWYLIDSTWQSNGNEFGEWYLAGQDIVNSTKTHKPFMCVTPPTLQKKSINYATIAAGSKVVNLMGTTNYKINNNNTVTITYDTPNNVNKNVVVNTSNNDWKSIQMKNNGKGLWSVTIPYSKLKGLYFYFTINNIYGTAGNISINNLETFFKGNGITAVKVM